MIEVMISVVIPVYNGEEFIGRAIESVRGQDGEWELIIVDDGSEDGTASVVARYADDDSRVRLLQSPAKGVTAARIFGAKNAGGDYVVFIDADDELEEGMLAAMEEAVASARMVDVVTGDIEHVSERGESHIQPYAHGVTDGMGLFKWITERRTGFLWGKAIRRELFLNLPYVPYELKFCEDYVQMLQLSLLADKVVHSGRVAYRYIQQPDSACNRKKTRMEYGDQFYKLGVALAEVMDKNMLFVGHGNKGEEARKRIKVMYLYYMRLYLLVRGRWQKGSEGLRRLYDRWVNDKNLNGRYGYDVRLRRQCRLTGRLSWLLSPLYVCLLKKQGRI